jgi:hypothetical protein
MTCLVEQYIFAGLEVLNVITFLFTGTLLAIRS